MTLHRAHEAFAARPVFGNLELLFSLLDDYDLAERHRILGPLYQEFFVSQSMTLQPGSTEEDGMEFLYGQFKGLLRKLAEVVPYGFIVRGVVLTTLVWLHGSSDETFEAEFIKNNRQDEEKLREKFHRGEINQKEFDRKLGEIVERINNLRSDMNLRRDYYERFCEQVVAHLPDGRP